MQRSHWIAWVSAILAILVVPANAKEGFGLLIKKATKLTRVTPPTVFLMGTRITVRVDAVEGDNGLAQRMQSQLESELLGRDPRLAADANDPQTLVSVTILQNEISERWETRQEVRSKKVGTDAKGKAVYNTYEVSVKYKIVTHGFSVSYRVTDQVKNVSLDADTVQKNYEDDFREGVDAPVGFTLENNAISQVVDAIARRITPTRDEIGVLLPKGRLETIAGLGDAGLWSRYLEALEAMPPSAKQEDEAYRQYALGTAYEALGYAAEDSATTLKYLEQADRYYNEAVVLKPDEKFFSKPYDSFLTDKSAVAPLERVRSALVGYRRIKDFQDNYDAMLAKATPALEAAKSMPEEADDGTLSNAAVIRMVKAGLSEDIILTAIEGAAGHAFDVSPGGLIQLSQAKVDRKIIARLQAISAKKPAAPTKKSTPSKGGTKP
jgi:hypothetical protein